MSMTTTITFGEVSLTGEKTGKCAGCGKRVVRREKFWQTLNPFNVNEQKLPKSRSEILKELVIEKDAWLKLPVYHQKCEPTTVPDDEFTEEESR